MTFLFLHVSASGDCAFLAYFGNITRLQYWAHLKEPLVYYHGHCHAQNQISLSFMMSPTSSSLIFGEDHGPQDVLVHILKHLSKRTHRARRLGGGGAHDYV